MSTHKLLSTLTMSFIFYHINWHEIHSNVKPITSFSYFIKKQQLSLNAKY